MIDIPQRIPSQIIDLAEKNVEQARGAFLGPCHGNFDGYHSPARLMTLGDHGCSRFPLCHRVEAMQMGSEGGAM